MRAILATLLLAELAGSGALATDWVRAGVNTNQPVWGVRGGLLWAVSPGGFRGREPRGLIRLGSPILPDGGYDLVNFLAIEPIVKGRKGFSELERSQLDGRQGKRIRAVAFDGGDEASLLSGRLTKLDSGAEQLEVLLRVEKFDNGAHVRLVVSQRSNMPDEMQLTVHAEPDSASMDYCILTATMGNLARTRLLWLKDEVISSLKLYPDYRDSGFAPTKTFPLERLGQDVSGETIVAITTDEANPSSVFPFPGSQRWHYGGFPVTQFWKKPKSPASAGLHAAVNGRFTYWRSEQPIPGGIAYENFELREPFRDGQSFIFGITRRTPLELGLKAKPSEK